MAEPLAGFGARVISSSVVEEQSPTFSSRRVTRVGPLSMSVLTVQGSAVAGPSGEQCAEYLRRNGIKAAVKNVPMRGGNRGEVILAEVDALGCDLLIKGAYTQSRLRQMIFGGATRYIINAATIPVLMAH